MTTILLSKDSIIECYTEYIIYNDLSYPFPIIIQNNNDSNINIILKLMVDTITNNNFFFIIGSSNVTFDGLNQSINISVNNYNGLFKQSNNDIENIIIQNFIITSTNGYLASNAGWLCQTCFRNGTINNCITYGNIDSGCCGGICGSNAFNCVVNKCHSSGLIGSYNNGGIYGNSAINCSAINCYSLGDIYGDDDGFSGGIYGSNSENCIASNCYSVGSIGVKCGGIFSIANNSEATNCYSLGNINIRSGGIFGINATDSESVNCYSWGDISEYGGGIFAVSAQSSTAINCYSTGDINNNGGGIFGAFSHSVDAINCYVSGMNKEPTLDGIFGNASNDINLINCYTESISGWDDINALSCLNNTPNIIWISLGNNTPFFLSSFNKQIYEPNIILSNTPNYISNNGILINYDYYIININDTDKPNNINIDISTGKITFIDCKPYTYIIKVLAISDNCYFYDKYTFIRINDDYIKNTIQSNTEQNNIIIPQNIVTQQTLFNKLLEDNQKKKKFNLKKNK
jgi:hypothetical protein